MIAPSAVRPAMAKAGKEDHVQIDRGWDGRLGHGQPGGAPGGRPGTRRRGEDRLVSAYEPVPAQRLREERREAPEDLQWAINPREDVDATLDAAAKVVREAGVAVDIYPRQGDPADAILDVAEEREADLIVVGNKGMTGAKRFLLGSVPNKVSHHAPCSVMIIRTT